MFYLCFNWRFENLISSIFMTFNFFFYILILFLNIVFKKIIINTDKLSIGFLIFKLRLWNLTGWIGFDKEKINPMKSQNKVKSLKISDCSLRNFAIIDYVVVLCMTDEYFSCAICVLLWEEIALDYYLHQPSWIHFPCGSYKICK